MGKTWIKPVVLLIAILFLFQNIVLAEIKFSCLASNSFIQKTKENKEVHAVFSRETFLKRFETFKKDMSPKDKRQEIPYIGYELRFDVDSQSPLVYSEREKMRQELEKRNWFWPLMSEANKERALRRLEVLLSKLDALLNLESVKAVLGRHRVVAITTAGSFLWHDHPGDIDLHFIVEGEKAWVKHELSPEDIRYIDMFIDSSRQMDNIAIQVFGIENLKNDARGINLNMKSNLQRKLLTIYGNGVQLAGLNLFQNTEPPLEDFAILAVQLMRVAAISSGDIIEKRLFEAMAIKKFIEHKKEKASFPIELNVPPAISKDFDVLNKIYEFSSELFTAA